MNNSLTDHELDHIKKTQAWLNYFIQLCFKHSTIIDWKIGGWILDINNLFLFLLSNHEYLVANNNFSEQFRGTREIIEEDKEKAVKTLKTLISWEGEAGFGAGNEKQEKFVSILNADKNWPVNHAYIDTWDAEYMNAPKLNFIGKLNEQSFSEFEELFVTFMNADTELKINTFKDYVKNKYP